jgi:hypothetical protein
MSQVGRPGTYALLSCLGLVSIGCAFQIEAVRRASNEFSCPPEQITAVERTDIAANVYDLNVCGTRVRYGCVWGKNVPEQCIREPDPPKWDPDSALVNSLPKPLGVPASTTVARVCGPGELSRCDDCLERDGAGWRWHHCIAAGPMNAQ